MKIRHWLITSTTYGTWLPGDARGFVSNVDVKEQTRQRHNEPHTPADKNCDGLKKKAAELLKSDPVHLNREQAEAVLEQIRETTKYRNWELLAGAVMSNHFHVLISAANDVSSDDIIGDCKSYASRRLNRIWGKQTWWTTSGSRRDVNEDNLPTVVDYIRNQEYPLALWIKEGY